MPKTFILLFSFFTTIGFGQQLNLEFYIFDQNTKQAIQDVHAFLINTTYGTTSQTDGLIQLVLPTQIKEDLLLTHIAYDSRLIEHNVYNRIQNGDTLFLEPNHLELDEIVVTSKRSGKWKKQFKKFIKAFLGDNKTANECTILNPEVLRFEETKGVLSATSVDLVHIENFYLGYTVLFDLREFTLSKDGSSQYYGYAKYEQIQDENKQANFIENRKETYKYSLKAFLKSLIDNTSEGVGYKIDNVTYRKNNFESLGVPIKEDLLIDFGSGAYGLYFPEFLRIIDTRQKDLNVVSIGTQLGGNTYGSFDSRSGGRPSQIKHATSYLSKLSNFLLLNEFGNILNIKDVKEYGYWAKHRQSQTLPFDYGNDYKLEKVSTQDDKNSFSPIEPFELIRSLIYSKDDKANNKVLQDLTKHWQEDMIPPLVEILRLSTDKLLVQQIENILRQKTSQRELQGFFGWMMWLWENPPIYSPYYADLKADLYQHIDPKFKNYFVGRDSTADIRIDEIMWGGVHQDGIPPLRLPKLLNVDKATYLSDSDVVFGVFINGIAKAYPKRILAWHEMFIDDFGDLNIAGVYCTLCGTVIAYDMTHNGVTHNLGTSGFLYRSNKLMYDKASQSLWSTIEGKPVLGPLANKNIELTVYPVVTTTWQEWQNAHPDTKVLSLDTGHDRNYGEGIAYSDYFNTDELMFPVPRSNEALKNKQEVVIIRAEGYRDDPIAISTSFLMKKKWYAGHIGDTNFVVLTDKSNAARVFNAENNLFTSYKNGKLKDDAGNEWILTAETIIGPHREELTRLPSHNAFWFAWYNTYPETRLVK